MLLLVMVQMHVFGVLLKNGKDYWKTADWTSNTDLQIKLQGSGKSTSEYFTVDNGVWGTYTVDFVAPTNATEFSLECRTYKNSTVIWDNMFFGESINSSVNTTNTPDLKVFVQGNNLKFNTNLNGETLEMYSVLGKQLQTSIINNDEITLNKYPKGVYIVRVGDFKQKNYIVIIQKHHRFNNL